MRVHPPCHFRTAVAASRSIALWLALASAAHGETPSSDAGELVVRGQRGGPEASTRDATAASTVVRGEALRRPGLTASDVIERTPGVQVTRTGAASDVATASVRGSTAAQLPVYLAGICLNDDVTGTADLSTLPLWALDRIEIFRGAAPVTAGRPGIAGALFFEPRLPRASEASLGGEVGGFGHRAAWLSAGVKSGDVAALGGARGEGASNDYPFTDDRGTRFDPGDDVERRRVNADFAARDGWLIARWDPGRSHVVALLGDYTREQGVTGLSIIPAERARMRLRRTLAGVSARLPCAGDERCQIDLATSAVVAESELRDPGRELALATAGATSNGQRVSHSAGLTVRVAPRWEVGASVRRAAELLALDHAEDGAALHARRDSGGVAAHVAFDAAQDLLLALGGAADCDATQGSGPASSCVARPSARLGARWQVAPWLALLANGARAVRVPTLTELYGLSASVRGNSALAPESAYTADAGLRARVAGDAATGPALGLDAFVFAQEARELIAFRRSSLGVIRPFNVGRARTLGAELGAGLRLWDRVGFDAAVTWLDARDTTPNRQVTNDLLPFRSRSVATAHVEVDVLPPRARGAWNRTTLGARVFDRSSRYADPAGLIVIAGHTTLDAEALLELWSRRLALRLAWVNVTDARSFDAVGLPLPGRSWFAGLEARL